MTFTEIFLITAKKCTSQNHSNSIHSFFIIYNIDGNNLDIRFKINILYISSKFKKLQLFKCSKF